MSLTPKASHQIARYMAILFFVGFALLPLYAAFVGSLTPLDKLGSRALIPHDWQWANYFTMWTEIDFLQYLTTTLIYAVLTAIVSVILGAPAAYALSRFRFSGRRVFVYFLLIGQVIPIIVIVIPLFRVVQAIGLYDTYFAVVLVVSALAMPLLILVLRSYFDTIPIDLEDAAMVDGCRRIGALVRVVLPVSAPGLLTAFSLAFFVAWQQFLVPLVVTESPDRIPVTVGLYRLISAYASVPWNLIMAGTLVAAIPPVIVYLVGQRFMVQGLLGGSGL